MRTSCWWECKLVHPGKTIWKFFKKKLKLELSYDSAITLLDIYLKKMKTLIQEDKCTVFTVALFTITDIRKQPKCPSMNG